MKICSARLVVLLMVCVAVRAPALDAKGAFAKVSPATVLISDLDSQGSGFFLNDKGLILTNYHVVAARIDLKVKARVKFGEKLVLTELDEVEVVKVHPTYDLALVQVKPPVNGSFMAAQLVPRGTPVDTGSKCFAIGNPGGPTGGALELSITEGLVSSASRKINGLEFVQFSAAVNPGNSGGPVCDESGSVFGVVTWKMEETEGLGFAIPTQKLAMTDFVEIKERRPNREVLVQAERAAERYFQLAKSAAGADRAYLLQAAAECYRVAMEADATRALPYHNLALIYSEVGQNSLAKKYLEAAVRVDPNYSISCHSLGVMLIEESPQNLERCLDLWFRGLADPKSKSGASVCAEDVAIEGINARRNPLACAYMLRWADVLEPNRGGPEAQKRREDMWSAIRSKAPADQLAAIKAKSGGFSRAEYDGLVAGKAYVAGEERTSPSVAVPTASGGSKPRPEGVEILPAMNRDKLEEGARSVAAKFNAQRVPLPTEGLEVPLPDVISSARLANGGCQVVMHFPTLAKFGVFNLAKAGFDGFIDCADKNVVFAAGGQVLLLYLPSIQMFEIYDLFTLQKKGEVKSALPGPVRFIGMGAINPLQVFVLCEERGTDPRTCYIPHLLNLPDFRETPVEFRDEFGYDRFMFKQGSQNLALGGAADAYGTSFAVWLPDRTPTMLAFYQVGPEGKVQFYFRHFNVTRASLSQDGSFLAESRRFFPRSEITAKMDISKLPFNSNPSCESRAAILGYAGVVELKSPQPSSGDLGTFRILGLPALNSILDIPAVQKGGGQSQSATIRAEWI